MKIYVLSFLIFCSVLLAFASPDKGKKVALIKMKRGKAMIISPNGTKVAAVKGEWVNQGAIVKTFDRSFVRLSFIDKSTMNVGPKSEMKIEKFSKKEAGVINVISGKIRSQVTKDYLKMDKDKSKLFVKSKSAVMGIRGTDFAFTTNPKTGASTAVLFEGSVVFSKINKGHKLQNLEKIVNSGQRIKPGQFSVASPKLRKATVPAKMSKKQFKALESNETFIKVAKKINKLIKKKNKAKKKKSVVPPGLAGDIVANSEDSLGDAISSVTNFDVKAVEQLTEKKVATEDSKGFTKGDAVKPADGSIVDIGTGLIIPIADDAAFDKNSGEWVSNTAGAVDPVSGDYLPPEGFKVTDEGKMLRDFGDGKVKEVVIVVGGIDDIKPLHEATTVEFRESISGPSPAGEPVAGNDPNSPEGGVDGPEGDGLDINDPGFLPPPPLPEGESFRPPSYNTGGAPDAGPAAAGGSSTRVKVNVIKGN